MLRFLSRKNIENQSCKTVPLRLLHSLSMATSALICFQKGTSSHVILQLYNCLNQSVNPKNQSYLFSPRICLMFLLQLLPPNHFCDSRRCCYSYLKKSQSSYSFTRNSLEFYPKIIIIINEVVDRLFIHIFHQFIKADQSFIKQFIIFINFKKNLMELTCH